MIQKMILSNCCIYIYYSTRYTENRNMSTDKCCDVDRFILHFVIIFD